MSNKQQLQKYLEELDRRDRDERFDAFVPGSRPTTKQQQILDDFSAVPVRYFLGGNQSGKSTLGAREITWLFQNKHPYIDTKKMWGNRPR